MTLRALIPLAALIGAAYLLAGCEAPSAGARSPLDAPTLIESSTQAAPNPGWVAISELQRGAIEVTPIAQIPQKDRARWAGRVDVLNERASVISAPIGGVVHEVLVAEGQEVAAGDAIAVLRSAELAERSAELQRERAALRRAREFEATQESLVASGAGTANSWRQAVAEREQLQASVRALEASLAPLRDARGPLLTLRAPVDGVVTELLLQGGDFVSPESGPRVVIVPRESIVVRAQLPESELLAMNNDARVSIHHASQEAPVQSAIVRIAPAVDTRRGRVDVWFSLPDSLPVRMGASVQVLVEREAPTLRVPNRAVVMTNEGEHRVWVEVAPDTFEAIPVTIGPSRDGFATILHGLGGQESIVTSGALLLDASASQML